ncbi:DUF4194 domain-containing protein [Pacificispira sp.]|uniref:DUF4194 domain-containing protein n=1 Tax=Pacificispira sp. TaxID=2888761 RepID=UPI003B51D667
MLKELLDIEDTRGEKEVEALIKAANYLIRNQFCVAGTRGGAKHYNVLTLGRYRTYFSSLFDALGYDITVNETEKWVGIIPAAETIAWSKMKMDETIVLLVMALRWQEGMHDGDLEEGAIVMATFNELHDDFKEIIGQNRKTAIPVTRFKEIVDDLIRRGIATRGEQDVDDFEIGIRPLINTLVGEDVAGQIAKFTPDETARLDAIERDRALNPDVIGSDEEAAEEDDA